MHVEKASILRCSKQGREKWQDPGCAVDYRDARDAGVWLETEAAAAYDELKADPAQALSVSQVRENLARRHATQARGPRAGG